MDGETCVRRAAEKVFAQSYEYTEAYREFCDRMEGRKIGR